MVRPEGTLCGTGYSGRGEGLNNPTMQNVVNTGPLPAGTYAIGKAFDHPMLGPEAIPLTPCADNQMFGRSHFYIHGDNQQRNKSASEGCIILDRAARNEIAGSPVKTLVVRAVETPVSTPVPSISPSTVT